MRSQTIHSKNDIGLRYEYPKCYPFVKWAGGKTQLLSQLNRYFPSKITRYFEPFVGGGAVFFYIVSQKNIRFESFLSDINEELIIAYKTIRDHVEELITILKVHEREYKKFPIEYYYAPLEDRKDIEKIKIIAMVKGQIKSAIIDNVQEEFGKIGGYTISRTFTFDRDTNIGKIVVGDKFFAYVSGTDLNPPEGTECEKRIIKSFERENVLYAR